MDSTESIRRLPGIAIAAAVIALLLGLGALVGSLFKPYLVLSAIVPTAAGLMILRGRASGAYGFAIFQLSQALIGPLALLPLPAGQIVPVVIGGIFNVGLTALFFFAGRRLYFAAGGKRGPLSPWIVVSALFLLPLFFVKAFVIPSGAMENTLLIGDHIIVKKFPRSRPQRGDVVVFRYPMDKRQIFIKRVIGISGDRIRIVAKTVYRNGGALNEAYVVHRFPEDKYRDNFPGPASDAPSGPGIPAMLAARDMLQNHVVDGEVVVPSGKYFVLGDNRDSSLDSRYWGFLDPADVIGRPTLIYYSEAPANQSGNPKLLPIQRTRWNRILRAIR